MLWPAQTGVGVTGGKFWHTQVWISSGVASTGVPVKAGLVSLEMKELPVLPAANIEEAKLSLRLIANCN